MASVHSKDLADPYTSAAFRGTAEILPDEVRVIIRVVPEKVVGFSA
ncbi:hypothetical protein ACIP79_28965 [Streptomyces sp. NPDC088747]